jgi:hypothetical protein
MEVRGWRVAIVDHRSSIFPRGSLACHFQRFDKLFPDEARRALRGGLDFEPIAGFA